MKKFIAITIALMLGLTGCSSGVSQEEYDALLEENEALRQELAQYTGEDIIQNEEAEDSPVAEYDPNAAPAAESDFLYVNNGTAVQINGYQGSGGYVVIPNEIEGVPVTRIAPGAFEEVKTITGIVLPEKLEYIGDSAFYWAENLTGVLVIPESVTMIDGHAFQVTDITGLVIQSDCDIEINAFANIDLLEFIYVKDGCAPRIGSSVFGYSDILTTAVFPDEMIEIEDETFDTCNRMIIYTPAGSFAEDYANRNFIKVDTAGYNEQVAKYSKVYG